MRIIKIEGIEIKAFALKRKDVRTLRAKGFAVSTVSLMGLTGEQWDDFIDALLRMYCDGPGTTAKAITALDRMEKKDRKKVELELIAETWGAEEEEKNS